METITQAPQMQRIGKFVVDNNAIVMAVKKGEHVELYRNANCEFALLEKDWNEALLYGAVRWIQ